MTAAHDQGGKPMVLVVDDNPENLSVMNALLRGLYRVRIATGGRQALELVAKAPPDLILLDIMMPEMDGYEVCRRLQANPAYALIPVIFLTAKSEVEDEQRGFDLGAVDYITKPISPPIVLARVKAQLLLKKTRDFLADHNAFLEAEVQARTRQVARIQDTTIVAMASLAETRDNETGNHIRRTQNYVRALARAMQAHPRFAATVNDAVIELLYKSAPLHDIGKVGIPDRILLKPGKLDDDEFAIMKTHARLGYEAILKAEARLEGDADFLVYAGEIAYCHHEKWDGSGYPRGLSGDSIPVSARLMAVADVYDALISRRIYKPPFSHEKAVALISEGRGSHFDPDLVDGFLRIEAAFRDIAAAFADHEAG
ncbi:putative cyclic di-GMP phosphodiesterase VC_1348 [Azospirillaceae bacterium]